ncbi:MAG: DotA/TraY family protein [Micavibrio sp.]
MNIFARRAIKHALMPEVMPRMRELLGTGFGFVGYAMACVFQAARLLPRGHAYTNPVNIGAFGISQVLGQAALNLKFSIRNIDQIILFVLMLVGSVLLLTQIGLMGFALFTQTASAAGLPLPMTFAGFFESPNPTEDISFIVMDRIFGIPGVFNSCVAQNIPCLPLYNPNPMSDGAFPQPYHLALQEMLGFYSHGLLFVAAIILGYYITTILAEMSETGTPFGKRFNRAWAPMRIVFALGLLIPMTHNLNASQYITLYIAKYGSAFGTNAWNFFITSIALSPTNTLAGDSNKLVAKPQYPSINEIIQFMSTAWTCKIAYKKMYDIDIDAYAVRSPLRTPNFTPFTPLIYSSAASLYDLQLWYELGDIVIVFGEHDAVKHTAFKGNVRPYCGEAMLPSMRTASTMNAAPTGGLGIAFHDGADFLAFYYLENIIAAPWVNTAATGVPSMESIGEIITDRTLPLYKDLSQPMPDANDKRDILNYYNNFIQTNVDLALTNMKALTDWTNTALNYGWAGAGIWYNKIGEVNGDFTEAVFNFPVIAKYPEIMEWVKEEKSKNNSAVSGKELFNPNLVDGQDVMEGRNEKDKAILTALNQTYEMWDQFYEEVKPKETGNTILDGINSLFKKTGLWTLRDNEDVHPLAAMASMGKSLLTNSIYAFGAGSVTGITGALSGAAGASIPAALMSNISSFMITLAFIGLVAGIMLYYIVPFMPFLYFFFAVVGWAKTIFEAMVGVPLWALAHLRYDGDGFPTRQSLYGYYLLIDIFLRPVLIVFGLIASMSIFYAMARTLNNVFDIVTSNLTGFDEVKATAPGGPKVGEVGSLAYFRGPVDQLFFTIIYSVVVYMIGMSCFKLIDLFPNSILRWMGSGAKGFGSMTQGDAGEELAQKVKGETHKLSDQAAQLSGAVMRRDISAGGGGP